MHRVRCIEVDFALFYEESCDGFRSFLRCALFGALGRRDCECSRCRFALALTYSKDKSRTVFNVCGGFNGFVLCAKVSGYK
jgi:hypothetical protein